jgi:hypothetical protein
MGQVASFFENHKNAILSGIGILVSASVVYYLFKPKEGEEAGTGSKLATGLTTLLVVGLLGLGSYFIYEYVSGDAASSGNLASTPVESSKPKSVPSAQTPTQQGESGGSYGLLYWMYIQDWDYKFGQTKSVIARTSGGTSNPSVTLHPTENTLQVTVSIYPPSESTAPSTSSDSSTGTGDSFTCSVTDVPLQTWFCVGVSLSGRNLDVYLNGLLVRSCVLPGVPRPVTADLEIMPNGGFSGKVIDVYSYARALLPGDVSSFCAKGTNGTKYTGEKLPSKGLFGYKVNVGVFNPSGKEVKKFVL